MADYKEILEKLARDRVSERMPSGMPGQAKIWFEVCFRHAHEKVCIYADKLDWDVLESDEVTAAAVDFLAGSGSVLQILIQTQPARRVESYRLVSLWTSEHVRGSVDIRYAKGSYAKNYAKCFAVMDTVGYRFETDANNCIAVANFNEPDSANVLLKTFEEAFRLAMHNQVFLKQRTGSNRPPPLRPSDVDVCHS